jgi:hypothetical protein
MVPFAKAISAVLGDRKGEPEVLAQLFAMWSTTIARLCIGLRRFGTGGAFLLTPKPIRRILQVGHPLTYRRLREATVLRVWEEQYSSRLERAQRSLTGKGNPVPAELAIEASWAEADAEDRGEEMTGAVKLVASLAAVDGLVLLTPSLSVVGFGVKIGSTPHVTTVYDGAAFALRGARARKIDPSQFGTRHGSMLRYCAQDRDALGLVVSQDGYVRLIMTAGKSLVFWNNMKLLGHMDYSRQAVLYKKARRADRRRRREPSQLGYTDMPKTIERLMKAAARQKKKPARRATKKG